MKVKDLMTIMAYLSGTTDKPLTVQVKNADGTLQNCDIKDPKKEHQQWCSFSMS